MSSKDFLSSSPELIVFRKRELLIDTAFSSAGLCDSSLDPSSTNIFFILFSRLRKMDLVFVSIISGYSCLNRTALA